MNQILDQIQHFPNWEHKYNQFAIKNNLNSVNFNLVRQQNFENFQNFIEAIVQKGPRKSKKRWVSNQRRILYVLLNCLSVMKDILVEQFNNQQIQRIQRVFPYKNKYSIQYQIRKLTTNSKQNRRRWSQKQELVLQQIVKKTPNKNKWNEIARELFIFSKSQYFRQGKHCRQRYFKLLQQKGQLHIFDHPKGHLQMKRKKQMPFHSHNNSNSSDQEIQSCSIQQNYSKSNFNNSKVKKQVEIEDKMNQKRPYKQKSLKLKINEQKQETFSSLSNNQPSYHMSKSPIQNFNEYSHHNVDMKLKQQELNYNELIKATQIIEQNNRSITPRESIQLYQNMNQMAVPYFVIPANAVEIINTPNNIMDTDQYQSWLACANFYLLYGSQFNFHT